MNPYYRGYLLGDLRQFPAWADSGLPAARDLADSTVVYLRDDLTVVRHPVQADEGVLWDSSTLQWREFCESVLRFEVPADLRTEPA